MPRADLPALLALLLLSVLPAAAAAPPPLPPAASRTVDFVGDIQPIFTKHCLGCHGPDKQRSSYRLDAKAIAFRGGESGHPAILPGHSADSPLLLMVAHQVPDLLMPPKGEPLSVAEVSTLRAWIDQGAPWPDSASVRLDAANSWWSLRPIANLTPPAVEGVSHPVDRFVRDRLARERLVPSPEADRRTLIRRLSFDLLGLPPTPAEVDAFVRDARPDAYEHLVDRLLASPHYGERWARHWLDVVHYGDTHGYDKDKPRPHAWPYRDYVIRSFNADKPYSRFVQEQLAGDAFFPDTAEGIEALGFISAGPWDFIGHEELPETKTDGKIARHLDRDDMVANTMGTFVSLTVHCAQCHDHKFDPIPQEDYYRLQAVFAAVDRTERQYYREPDLNRKRSELEARSRQWQRDQRALEEKVTLHGGDALKEVREQLASAEKSARDGRPAAYGFHSGIATREDESRWVQVDLGESRPLSEITLLPCHDDFNGIGAGFGFPRRFRIEASDDPAFDGQVTLLADRTAADVPNPGLEPVALPFATVRARYVRVTATRLAPRQNDFIFALAELEARSQPGGTNVARGASVTSLDSVEAPERWQRVNLTDGKAPRTAPDPAELERLRQRRDAILAERVPAEVRDGLTRAGTELEATRKSLEALPKPLTTFVGAVHYGRGNFRGTGPDEGRPRPIPLLSRGDVNKPGRPVSPGALRCVTASTPFPPAEEASESARRIALAQWILDPQNPLSWRSIVNRAWQQRFGRGLVDTPNDFGKMGGLPSHPELLDWLAREFRDGAQSFKQLDRLLVTSATYRQVSHRAESSDRDADNRLLWRMNPRRLDAESVRDAILAVSGKLDPTPFGPGFQDFVIEKPEHSPHYQYHLHDPEDPRSHRRSVYRFLVRSQQEPFMVALDCADPSMRVDRRNETLTPLQALAMLNSRLTVAMAQHFAQRVKAECSDSAETQVAHAFRHALQREPEAEERARLTAYTQQHGLAATCRVLLNLNEFVFVD
ncbi:MAG: DUF1549 domain-containing protein [Verrucomicrobiales bacterium]|nr:DUF1549 domain-containing protein [Verrucomicrobiales bacterium]